MKAVLVGGTKLGEEKGGKGLLPPVLASVLQGVSKASGVAEVPFSPKVGAKGATSHA